MVDGDIQNGVPVVRGMVNLTSVYQSGARIPYAIKRQTFTNETTTLSLISVLTTAMASIVGSRRVPLSLAISFNIFRQVGALM